MGQYHNEFRLERDQVFVAEMVRRGFDAEDFRAVIDSLNGRSLLIPQLEIAGQTGRYIESILETIHRYENLPDVNHRIEPKIKAEIVWSHLAEVIRTLPRNRGPDFSEAMLELAVADHETELALNYLYDRIVYQRVENPLKRDLGDKLAAMKAPPGSEDKRDFIVKWIRSRPR